jgi:hypothetical protein
MSLADRKLAELSAKLASVERELSEWRSASSADGPLEKHHTQVHAISKALTTLAAGIQTRLDEVAGAGSLAADAVTIELMILELHRIWDFFRSKLALRYVPWFQSYLLVADELAWSCYEPVTRWIGDQVGKEPPLVFLNGGSSPFTLPRGSAYDAEQVPGEDFRTERFRAELRHLPIPVVGVPWFQLQHLPDALVIAHEIGHDVEADLGLTEHLRTLVESALAAKGVDEGRRRVWLHWIGETFADVYGALATGPAYVATLIDFLSSDTTTVSDVGPGRYPPAAVRVLVASAVVELNGLSDEARAMRDRWREADPSSNSAGFEDDTTKVAVALVEGTYPQLDNGDLRTLLTFGPSDQDRAVRSGEEAAAGRQPPAGDVRVLSAAARLAFDSEPDGYQAGRAGERIMRKIGAVRKRGVRAGPNPDDARPDDAAREARDARVGQGLFDLVSETADRVREQEEHRDV